MLPGVRLISRGVGFRDLCGGGVASPAGRDRDEFWGAARTGPDCAHGLDAI
jgi:hypothetical protein